MPGIECLGCRTDNPPTAVACIQCNAPMPNDKKKIRMLYKQLLALHERFAKVDADGIGAREAALHDRDRALQAQEKRCQDVMEEIQIIAMALQDEKHQRERMTSDPSFDDKEALRAAWEEFRVKEKMLQAAKSIANAAAVAESQRLEAMKTEFDRRNMALAEEQATWAVTKQGIADNALAQVASLKKKVDLLKQKLKMEKIGKASSDVASLTQRTPPTSGDEIKRFKGSTAPHQASSTIDDMPTSEVARLKQKIATLQRTLASEHDIMTKRCKQVPALKKQIQDLKAMMGREQQHAAAVQHDLEQQIAQLNGSFAAEKQALLTCQVDYQKQIAALKHNLMQGARTMAQDAALPLRLTVLENERTRLVADAAAQQADFDVALQQWAAEKSEWQSKVAASDLNVASLGRSLANALQELDALKRDKGGHAFAIASERHRAQTQIACLASERHRFLAEQTIHERQVAELTTSLAAAQAELHSVRQELTK
ncbi:Aste57867_10691 [Aphanomyces stellatus]|uniref:Aste57867_10691 protein n=1 Tax=Aphanomyces stellatus TaxID=120398 RepID=A0A485KR43_9STRA|nr:hypothetical protein As57867_010651 [Aphanomyces stellatus]VFT87561.1 Aste57867_10691 [Aphanomyces stellatus]